MTSIRKLMLAGTAALALAACHGHAHAQVLQGTRLTASTKTIELGWGGEVPFTVGTIYQSGYPNFRGLKVVCTTAGNVQVQYLDGSTGVWPVVVGTQALPMQVVGVVAANTTATATYFGLK